MPIMGEKTRRFAANSLFPTFFYGAFGLSRALDSRVGGPARHLQMADVVLGAGIELCRWHWAVRLSSTILSYVYRQLYRFSESATRFGPLAGVGRASYFRVSARTLSDVMRLMR